MMEKPRDVSELEEKGANQSSIIEIIKKGGIK